MAAGRKPLATADKKLRGNPGKAKLNDQEPEPELVTEMPAPPDFLGKYAVESWNKNGPVLIELGLLTESDMELFASLCQAFHVLVEASLEINEKGMTIIGARGRVRNPALATFAAAQTQHRALSAEFGMSPSSRSRIKVPDADGPGLEGFEQGASPDEDVS